APDFTRSLDIDLEFEAPRRVRMRPQAADARAQPLAAIEAPGEERVLAARHIAELVSAPGQAHRVRVVRVVALVLEPQRIADAELAPEFLRRVVAKAGERRALHDQAHARLGKRDARDERESAIR